MDDAGIPRELIGRIRPGLPDLVGRITTQIQDGVTVYAGSPAGRRRRLIEMAVNGAISHFVDSLEGKDVTSRRVDELFRQMGHGEARDGHDLGPMETALRIATHDAWNQMRTFAVDHQLSATVLGHLGDMLFAFIDHLAEQTAAGFTSGRRALDTDRGTARAQLLKGLLAGAPLQHNRSQAAIALWPLPETFVVASIITPDGAAPAGLAGPDTAWLTGSISSTIVVIGTADAVATALDIVATGSPEARSAVTWGVGIDHVPDAHRWSTRVHELVAWGVIADEPLIHCVEHRTQIWLHAEPALRQRLCQEMLRPLLAETPKSREILSETLLAWLESRDSAPAIAARLNVHPQTVRYRWKRINELFGDALHEPEFVVQVTMLLKASVPLWKAGDQSDFERFRAEDGR